MNWKRIILFALAGFVISKYTPAVIAAPTVAGPRMFLWIAAAVISQIIPLAWFAAIQRERTVLHVGLAAAIGWLPSFVQVAILRDAPPLLWVSSFVVLVVITAIGLGIGLLAQRLFGRRTAAEVMQR